MSFFKGARRMAKKKTKIIEANAKTSDLIGRIEGFSLRFNTDILDNGKTHFKNRCISAIGEFIGSDVSHVNYVSSKVFYLLGIPYNYITAYFDYSRSGLYRLLTHENLDLKNDKALFKWLMILECILNIDMQGGYRNISLAYKISESLKTSGINAVLCETADGYLFYPANAELLDQKLIVDTLNWLNNYPEAKEQYNTALRTYLKGALSRNVIDSLRLSVELFFKQLFNNDSSLENQLKAIGEYLKGKNVAVEIRNMYVKLLNYFAVYNNQHIKHNDHSDEISSAEVEYLIYTTGAFLRFIMQLEKAMKVVE
jgi:hypothetical protein